MSESEVSPKAKRPIKFI